MSVRGIGLALLILAIGCGRGDAPRVGIPDHVKTFRVKILTDTGLPSLTDEQLKIVLDRARTLISKHYKQDVSFELAAESRATESLATESPAGLYQRLAARVGPFEMQGRLDPAATLTENEGRSVYRALFMDLNKDRLGWALERIGMSPDMTDLNQLYPAFMSRFGTVLETLAQVKRIDGEPVLRPQSRNAQSLYSWFILFNGLPHGERPAEILFTPDLLFHDALPSIPVDAILNGGMVYGYTKHHPGIVMISTLPFLSTDPVFAARQGELSEQDRLDLIAWTLAGELGGEYLRGEELNPADARCPSGWIEEPYVKELADVRAGGCDKPHDRYELQGRYIGHIGAVVAIELRDGRFDHADTAWAELKAALPDDPAVGQLRRYIDSEKSKRSATEAQRHGE